MDKNFTREWQKGDIYAPHDLSAAEARKWRKRYPPTVDAFDALSLNPLDFYKVRLPFSFGLVRCIIDIGLFRTSLLCRNT